MIEAADIVKAYINSIHGWAVADQFYSTFANGEDFAKQNPNALKYIADEVANLIDSDALSEETKDQLEEYYDGLIVYLEGDDEE